MWNSKTLFFKFITPVEKVFPIQGLLKLSNRKLILPLFHSVNESVPPHLQYLYKVRNKKEFIYDIDTLLKLYRPIDLFELFDIIDNDKQISKPCFHLTFDDGLSSFYDTVAPLLLEKGIPATCFLNSSFIDNKALFFRHKISIIIDKLHREKGSTLLWKKYHTWSIQHNLPKEYYQNQLLSIRYDQRDIIDEIAGLLEIDFLKYLLETRPYMDKEQIDSLITKGFTFGAHSIDHPEYRFIPEEDQLFQTSESLRIITSKFKLSYRVFSFPFTDHGVHKSFFNAIFNEKIADISFGTAGMKRDDIKYNLQRIPAELNNLSLKEILKKEYLYYCLLKTLHKHQIKRF